jgi:N-acetylglucosaminyldiphosphoundecaprenol N-acetyl-beta-D-mannosaminyltransferase
LLISYANANTINIAQKNPEFKENMNARFLVHPDGIGIYSGWNFLNLKPEMKSRFSGSDFYLILAKHLQEKKFKIFFFGHRMATLEKIKILNPGLNICGLAEGYNFQPETLITLINSKEPDILVVGLGQPLQEQFILNFHEKINCSVIIAIGDGIKVFSGEKVRGPEFFRKIGLEWLIRLLNNP